MGLPNAVATLRDLFGRPARDAAAELFRAGRDGDARGRVHVELARPRGAVLPLRMDHLVVFHQALDRAGGG